MIKNIINNGVINMKSKSLIFPTILLALGLAGCGKQELTTTKSQYPINDMAATIKGTLSAKKVTYKLNNQTKSAPVNSDTFFFTVPAKTTAQSITIKSGNKTKTVTVASQNALAKYDQFAKKYNKSVTQSKLPTDLVARLQKAQKTQKQSITDLKELAKTDPSAAAKQQATMSAEAQQLNKDYQQATKAAAKKTKGQTLNSNANGLTTQVKTANYQIRTNVDNNQLLSMALIIPTAKLKTADGQKDFGTALALMANAAGANSKEVLKQFGDQVKKQKNNTSSTQTHTITSNGIHFKTAVSAEKIYVFMTK